MLSPKRFAIYIGIAAITLVLVIETGFFGNPSTSVPHRQSPVYKLQHQAAGDGVFNWATRTERYPVSDYEQIPKPSLPKLPQVQYHFKDETESQANVRQQRQSRVKQELQRCWKSYRDRAWLHDELTPISGDARDPFGGWAATLVDTLDTLWIMNLKEEFKDAVDAAISIDFTKTSQGMINVFETTIRYLGGFLSAYDLSNDKRLLDKGLELADMLYAAFDTPNRLPITRWDFHKASEAGHEQEGPDGVLVAEIGSLTLEFTRLSQITNDPKWYDAVARIMAVFDEQQNQTDLPGMWPLVVNARDRDFASGNLFTLGAMSDSVYEYLPKMYALLSGSPLYERLWYGASSAAAKHALYRPMTPGNGDVLMAGAVEVKDGTITTQPEGQHLVCFAGGMFALGGRLMQDDKHVELGRKLTDGCTWAYRSSALGIMPETYTVVPCKDSNEYLWNETRWHEGVLQRHGDDTRDAATIVSEEKLPPGFTSMNDRRYILRPETIESVLILYRVTGDSALQEVAWQMFESISKHTQTEFGNAAINDISDTSAPKSDSMESFWTAETLKYFYLVFSKPDLISLDDYVFNTEAHPLKRPSPRKGGFFDLWN